MVKRHRLALFLYPAQFPLTEAFLLEGMPRSLSLAMQAKSRPFAKCSVSPLSASYPSLSSLPAFPCSQWLWLLMCSEYSGQFARESRTQGNSHCVMGLVGGRSGQLGTLPLPPHHFQYLAGIVC